MGLVLRELTSLALLVQFVWISASPELWPTNLRPPLAGATVAFSLLTWIVLLVMQYVGSASQRRWARYADVAAIALAFAVTGATAASSGSWDEAFSLAVLCAGLIGALVEVRAAVVLVALLAFVTLEPVLRSGPLALPAGAPTSGVAAYVAIIGGCIIGVRLVLERNARRVDDDTARRDEIERQQRMVEGVEHAMRRQERLLHETVLNTLTAIARGGLGGTPAAGSALEQRCVEAIDVLSDLESGAQAVEPTMSVSPLGYVTLTAELAAFIDGLRADGLVVDVVLDSLEDVPDRVRGALLTAIREALTNVARHADAQRAAVLVRVRRDPATSVRVEVRDDGVGFDPTRAARGFGLNRAITWPMQEVGGTARVDSAPGEGTRVVLEWTSRSADAIDRFRAGGRGFVLPAVATFGLFLAATASLAWLQFDHPPISVTDVALVAVLGILISLATPEAPVPWGLILTISALGPLFALLQASGDGSSDPAFGGGWALSAIAAFFMAAAAIGPRWAWVPLVVSWLLIEGDPAGTLLQPATVVVLGGSLMGRSLRRDSRAVEVAHLQRLSAQTALDITRESLARLRARYGALEDSVAIELLGGIVSGRFDPEDPDVRRRAGLEETFIRNLVRIDPETDRLRAMAARLSRAAHRRGVHLRADLSLPRMPSVVVGSGVAESFGRAVESTVLDDSARLTARREGDEVVVTLLTPIIDGERDHMRALPVPGIDTDPGDPSDPVMLWEVRLGSESRA
jgi:signal transduction histidine kinase